MKDGNIQIEDTNEFEDVGNQLCWFTKPEIKWEIGWYFGFRGGESMHLYIWVMKDLCW